jgi:hypothetical protein
VHLLQEYQVDVPASVERRPAKRPRGQPHPGRAARVNRQ